MARDYKQYRRLLQSLLPRGRFWTRAESATLTQVLNGLGEELSRVEGRAEDLIIESIPSRVDETLEEWEEDFNIPDSGFSLADSISGRRAVIKAKHISVGQQNKGYFIEIASALGYITTITEFDKSLAGIATAGGYIATDERGIFYWMVDIDVSSAMMEFYTLANISQLITSIESKKPAHSIVLFRFVGVEFSNGFSQGFNAVPWYDGSSWPISFSRGFSSGFANAYDYDGVRLVGSFDSGFSEGFDSYRGGGFSFDEFSTGFSRPS
jgi:uncharacterized protein YmfQ (DUF2313 family)